MSEDHESSNSQKKKGVAFCEDREDVVSVWIKTDGSIDPISPEGVCSCEEPSLRLIDETERGERNGE